MCCNSSQDSTPRGNRQLACSVRGGGSEARSAKLRDCPRRMTSRNCKSASFRNSWNVMGGGGGAAVSGVRPWRSAATIGIGCGVGAPLLRRPSCANKGPPFILVSVALVLHKLRNCSCMYLHKQLHQFCGRLGWRFAPSCHRGKEASDGQGNPLECNLKATICVQRTHDCYRQARVGVAQQNAPDAQRCQSQAMCCRWQRASRRLACAQSWGPRECAAESGCRPQVPDIPPASLLSHGALCSQGQGKVQRPCPVRATASVQAPASAAGPQWLERPARAWRSRAQRAAGWQWRRPHAAGHWRVPRRTAACDAATARLLGKFLSGLVTSLGASLGAMPNGDNTK